MNKYDLDCTPSEGFDYITKNGKTARCSEILVDILVLQSQLKKSQEREKKLEIEVKRLEHNELEANSLHYQIRKQSHLLESKDAIIAKLQAKVVDYEEALDLITKYDGFLRLGKVTHLEALLESGKLFLEKHKTQDGK